MASKRPTFGGEGPDMLRGTCILPILGTLLVALRLVTANRKAREVRWDAVWIGIGIVWAIASYITFAYSVSIGIGNHVRALTYSQIFEALRWTWVSIFVGLVAGIFAKLAIIALLLGVQPHSATKTRTMLWGLGILLAATNVTQIILTLNKCKPLAKLWNPTIEGVCPLVNVSAQFSYYQGGIHAFADIFLSLFPITIVWNLQASKKVKIGFCALMASGSIPSVAVITRTTLLKKLSTSKDITYDFGHFMLWATLELWTVVIISSIPPLRPLFLRCFSKMSTVSRSRGTGFQTENTHNQPSAIRSPIPLPVSEAKTGMITQTTQINIDVESVSTSSREKGVK